MTTENTTEFVREDDFVEYFIYFSENYEQDKLISYLNQCLTIVDKYSKNYLWHKDKFNLRLINKDENILNKCIGIEKTDDSRPYLYGVTHFGDNIEDEWFIVFLLFQLSREISDIIIRVIDNDGEFLLIEAANSLPNWANPETCENRVYIHQGKIHIIPIKSETDNPVTIEISEAIQEIIQNPQVTEASNAIQKQINTRIQDYPKNLSTKLHKATLYLPIGVAAILKAKPQLVAPAVLAFCNRDQIDLKACRAMRYFPPENRVLTSVMFTKHLYAMLSHSNYVPDRRTGWNLPPSNNQLFKAHNLGLRLACGFEILISQAKSPTDLESDRSWHNFMKSLNKQNYFRDLLEHSKEYNELLEKAKVYYKEKCETAHSTPLIGKEILDLSKTLDFNEEDLKMLEKNLPEEDDDSWLSVNPTDIDKLLEDRYGKNFENGNTDPVNLTKKLSDFMNQISSYDGAIFPSESSPPSRPKRGVKNTKKPNEGRNESPAKTDMKINFDPDGFSNAIQNILDLAIPDDSWDLESGSEMSEYDNETENMSLDEQMGEVDVNIKKYMDAMDKELASTTIGQSFEKKRNGNVAAIAESDNFDDIESFKPIDIDRNALKNILKSWESQLGDAGPAENLLGPMGIKLDDLNIDDD
ncbi:protein ecdysoneless [Chrysoperla carnea]|uniref:protein ecdysoneless n=1 Tax=Chrysoperla carnea TaxID=189513 RepID=UPI001D071FA2|nr:protein ecdysoneless [Chrysoperla carnea]